MTTRTLRLAFPYGATVYHKAAAEKMAGIVTSFLISAPNSPVIYMVSWGDGREGNYFDVELTDEFEPDYPKGE